MAVERVIMRTRKGSEILDVKNSVHLNGAVTRWFRVRFCESYANEHCDITWIQEESFLDLLKAGEV